MEGAGSNALGRAAPVVLVPSKDVRLVGRESHQLDIVDQTVGAGAEVDADVEFEVGVEAEDRAEVGVQVGADAEVGAEIDAEIEVEAEVQIEVEVEVEIGVDAAVEVEAEAEVQVEVETEAEVDAERVEFEADAEVEVEVEVEVEGAEAGFGNSLQAESADEPQAESLQDAAVVGEEAVEEPREVDGSRYQAPGTEEDLVKAAVAEVLRPAYLYLCLC